MCTPSNRLMYREFMWDHKLAESNNITTWTSEVKSILCDNGLSSIFEKQQIFPVKSTIVQLKESLLQKQKSLFKSKCEEKPKLRTFVTFKDFENQPPHVGKPLSFKERRIISKIRLGILPLRIGTARYLRPVVPECQRTCYCGSGL